MGGIVLISEKKPFRDISIINNEHKGFKKGYNY